MLAGVPGTSRHGADSTRSKYGFRCIRTIGVTNHAIGIGQPATPLCTISEDVIAPQRWATVAGSSYIALAKLFAEGRSINLASANDVSESTSIVFSGGVSRTHGDASVKFFKYLKCWVRSLAHIKSRYLLPLESQKEWMLRTSR